MLKKIFNKIKNTLSIKGGKRVKGRRIIYAVVGVLAVYWVYKTMTKNRGRVVIEGLANGDKKLVLFHMKGCGHCDSLMPDWDAFEKKNTSNIATQKLERTEAGGLLEKHKIDGFPTILLLDKNDNKVSAYNGERTTQGLIDFCNKNE